MTEGVTVVFAGESARNREWLGSLVTVLEDNGFSRVLPWTYSHWLSGGDSISVSTEVSVYRDSAQARPEPTFAVAKSAGTAVVQELIDRALLAPDKLVLIGVPVRWATAQGIDLLGWLADLQIPTLILQNEHDPACTASALRDTLKDNVLISVVPLKGDAHSYEDFGSLAESIRSFFGHERQL